MPSRHSLSLVRRSWWVFGLFIATPGIMLALLGLGGIRADDVQRRAQRAEQRAQVARLANAALSTALQREIDQARHRALTPGAAFAGDQSIHFELEADRTVVFQAHRLYVPGAGLAVPARLAAAPLPPSSVVLVERAQAAEAQGRLLEARALYDELRATAATRDWADLQLSMLPAVSEGGPSTFRVPAARLADSDARSPSGIPLAIVASSYMESAAPHVRTRFVPLLEQTLRGVRAGRWWMSLAQRRAYEGELRGWLREVAPAPPAEALDLHTEDVEHVSRVAQSIVESFENAGGAPSPAQFIGTGPGRHLLLWVRPDRDTPRWSGVAMPSARADALIGSAVLPLLKAQPFRIAVRQEKATVWGTDATPPAGGDSLDVDAIPGWSFAFTDVSPPVPGPRRLLNYARVVFPVVVLACGLVMTAWIIRRETALREMQAAFAAAVTHEFKSPITGIRLLMERITSGRHLSPEATDRYHAAIRAETDRLEALVNRLLDAQKLQTGQKHYAFRPARMDALVREVIEAMRPQAEARQIAVDLQPARGLPSVALDIESMADAVRNLLDNAIKYSPERGRVTVAISASEQGMQLDVIDEGIGVDPHEATRVFEPFYRSHRGDHANVQGTGLGLSLVKATAEAHGGSVLVSSDGLRGSRFTLRLPVGPVTADPEPDPAAGPSMPSRATPR